MLTFTVERQIMSEATRKVKTKKFSVIGLGFITADSLWDGGENASETRPVYLSVTGKETTLRPFLANMRAGTRADMSGASYGSNYDVADNRIRLLKTAGYQVIKQKNDDIAMVTFYLPQLFQNETGMIDAEKCAFISAPPQWWIKKQVRILAKNQEKVNEVITYMRRGNLLDEGEKNIAYFPQSVYFNEDQIIGLIPVAVHHLAAMDKRTRFPLLQDYRFAVRLYLSAMAHGITSMPATNRWSVGREWNIHKIAEGFQIENREGLGFGDVTATLVEQEKLGEFLSDEVREYQKEIG